MSDRPLKLLMAHKFFFPFGGPESYMFEWQKLMESHGHKTIFFSMKHPRNVPCEQSEYFVENVDYSEDGGGGGLSKLKSALKIIYSFEARKKMAALVKDEKPDLAHFQNIYHQLSPSIIAPLYKRRIPMVMKLADYKLICLNYQFLHGHKVCNACLDGRYRKALRAKCVRDSFAATFINYMEHKIHGLMRVYEKIDLLIAPSNFLRDLHIKRGIDPERIVTVENFKDLKTYTPQYEHKGYVLFFGRFSVEKGIRTLVDSMREIPEVPLKIAGRGPDEEILREYARESGLKNVEFVGFKTGDELAKLIKDSAIVVVPSEWYENCSNTVIEAFAYGKPVIGSDIGGIPEQVLHGKNGLLFPPGDSEKLAEAIGSLYGDDDRIRQMGIEGRKTVETKYSGERHYERLMEIYYRLIREKSGK